MGHQIYSKPNGIILSSAIGNIMILADNSFVDVKLTSNGFTILSERYYANLGNITLYDFASLIEEEMRRTNYSCQTFILEVYGSSTTPDDTCTFSVLYCDRFSVCTDVPFFLKENFLTTLDARRIPIGASQSLFFYADLGESLSATVSYSVRDIEDNILHGSFILNYGSSATFAGEHRIDISQATILENARSTFEKPIKSLKLLSFNIIVGKRSVSYWVDTLLSIEDTFYFRNCFNVWEAACLPFYTTAKTEVDRSTAIVNGDTLIYNQSATKSYEVKASALTSDEANWIDQLFTSHSIFRVVPNPGDETNPVVIAPVIITDSSCEIQNGDEKLNEVKFTWRFAGNRPLVQLSASKGIFTSQYNIVFS